jgi:hypothetical protein
MKQGPWTDLYAHGIASSTIAPPAKRPRRRCRACCAIRSSRSRRSRLASTAKDSARRSSTRCACGWTSARSRSSRCAPSWASMRTGIRPGSTVALGAAGVAAPATSRSVAPTPFVDTSDLYVRLRQAGSRCRRLRARPAPAPAPFTGGVPVAPAAPTGQMPGDTIRGGRVAPGSGRVGRFFGGRSGCHDRPSALRAGWESPVAVPSVEPPFAQGLPPSGPPPEAPPSECPAPQVMPDPSSIAEPGPTVRPGPVDPAPALCHGSAGQPAPAHGARPARFRGGGRLGRDRAWPSGSSATLRTVPSVPI